MRKSKNINITKRVICMSLILILIIMVYIFPREIEANETYPLEQGNTEMEPVQEEIEADETDLPEQSNTETELVQEDLETANEQRDSENTDFSTFQNYISGVIWLDVKDDGIRDTDETGIENYPIYLYAADNLNDPVVNTVTNQNGLYTFADIPPGEYVVGIKPNENDTDYLLPFSINNENKFAIDKESDTRAFTKVITIESKTIVENIDGGMREMLDVITRDVPNGYVVTRDDTQERVGIRDTLKKAVGLCKSDSIAYTITLTGNDTSMTGDTGYTEDEVYVTIPKNRTITLTSGAGGSYTITQKQRSSATDSSKLDEIQNARHLNVEGTLILDNIILKGVGYNSKYPFGYTGGVYVDGGSLTMRNNTSITNCYNREGGAVYVDGETSTSKFVMDGGTIFANKAMSIQKTSTSAYGHGGGVCAYGSNASFKMSGGAIKQNEILQNNTGFVRGYGGGVAATDGAVFDMYGVAHIDNNTASYGAGVYISEQSTFNMYGNTQITNNIAKDKKDGGGVCARYSSTFNMYGEAVIKNNKAQYGGGTYLNSSIMNMSGKALITKNQTYTQGGTGGGVIVRFGSTLNMKDSAIVSDNTATLGLGGGGVRLTYDDNVSATLNMADHSKIIDNKTNMYGGGVFSDGKVVMSDNAEISGNVADSDNNTTGYGGGIFIHLATASVSMNGNSIITKNTASGNGGGVHAYKGTLYMNDTVTISENIAKFVGEGGGGGVYLSKIGYLKMTGGTIENNQADAAMGGGVYTLNYLYEDPVDDFTKYYTNITIKGKDDNIFSPFSGNTASEKYKEPSNADKSTQFNGYDLTNYSINYENKKVYYPLEFYKIDGQITPDYKYLEGAKFNLYKWTGSGKPSAIVDVDIPGDWEPIATLTSDENGFVQYDQLEIGKYYQLIEVKAPDSYSVPDGQWQIYIKTAYTTVFPYDCYKVIDNAPAFEKINDKDEYFLTNEKDPEYDFNFTKVDAADNSILIAGVEFSLYEWTAKSPISGLVDVNDPSNNWTLVGSVASDSIGKISFAGLSKGSYQLVETQAHSGYHLPTGQWQIIVNADGSFGITAVNGTDGSIPPAFKEISGSYILGNYVTTELPSMGGVGTFIFRVLGVMIIFGSIFGFIHFYRRRRKLFLLRKNNKY